MFRKRTGKDDFKESVAVVEDSPTEKDTSEHQEEKVSDEPNADIVVDSDDIYDFEHGFAYVDDDSEESGRKIDADAGVIIVDDDEYLSLGFDKVSEYEVEVEEVTDSGERVTVKKKVKPLRRRRRKKIEEFSIGLMREENFGDLLPLIKDINVTDINWNGKVLWVDDVTKGRYSSGITLSNDFVEAFSVRVSNVVSKSFNKYSPKLEAETDDLRITVIHDSVSHTGCAISIRKTPAVKRISFAEQIRNGSYCSEKVANLMSNCVKAKMNIIVCGLPGVGKTELVKFLTNYIFPHERAITIEDTLEIRYSDINPGKDCLEFKVNDTSFDYTQAIKSSMRLLPQWVLLSEARSTEVRYLIESVSTGAKCITTLHTDDVRKIPDRILNMIGQDADLETITNSIYSFFDVGILIDKITDDTTGRIRRYVSQVCLFNRDNGVNECIMLVDNDGQVVSDFIPEMIAKKFKKYGINDPMKYTFI